MKKKIAIIHYTSPPVLAGVEFVIKDQIQLFKTDGYNVKLISGKGNKFRDDIDFVKINQLDPQDKKYIQIRNQLEKGQVSPDFYQLSAIIFEKLALQLKDIDVCIIHQALSMHFNLCLTEAIVKLTEKLGRKIKFIHWTHDNSFFDKHYQKIIGQYKAKFPYNLLTKKHSNIQYVTISEFRQKQLSKLYSVPLSSIKVIPNGIDITRFFKLDQDLSTLVKDLNLDEQDLVAFLPNRIFPRKNIQQAVKIIYELKKLGLKIRFILTGVTDYNNPDSANYYKKIKSQIKKDNLKKEIIILNDYQLSNGKKIDLVNLDITKLYFLSDFLLYPSRLEGFGLQVIEAGITKTPVVCSNIDVFKETGQQDCLYFKIDENPAKTATNIIKFLQKIPTSRAYRRQINQYSLGNIYQNKIKPIIKV